MLVYIYIFSSIYVEGYYFIFGYITILGNNWYRNFKFLGQHCSVVSKEICIILTNSKILVRHSQSLIYGTISLNAV